MGQKRALLIGVNDYQDVNIPDLRNPLRNVLGLREVLTNPKIGGFAEENLVLLTNPTYKSAKREIFNLFEGSKRDDLILLYFSGHGFLANKELHLALYDTDKEYLVLEALPASFIAQQMSASRAKQQVLILDCCHSGAFEPPPGLKAPVNAIVLTASDKTEYSWESEQGEYSLFTRHLIEGLNKGTIDSNTDGEITVEEIYYYIRRKLADSKQNPLRLYPFGRQEESIVLSKSTSYLLLQDVDFMVGDFKADDIVPEYLFLKDLALSIEDLHCDYQDYQTPLLADLIPVKEKYIETQVEESKRTSFTFDNNLSYSLYSFSISRGQSKSGQRHNQYLMRLRPTDYFSFVFPNSVLDKVITVNGNNTTPREVLGISKEKIRLENLKEYNCDFMIGTATVFVTNDNKIVVSLRSRAQYIVGGATYHLSTAEGMLRPVDNVNGEISPFHTCIRSLGDELGLKPEEDFASADIRCIGLFLDVLRAQPLFIFYLKSKEVTFDEVKDKWRFFAKDKHENRDVIGLEWNLQTAKKLVQGKLNYSGLEIEVASNHAQTGFIVGSLHEFGRAFLR